MDYKLIAIDMDGTLLNDNKEIDKRTKDALDQADKKGVNIVLATGRMLKSAYNYSNRINLNKPIIACNGSILLDEDLNIAYRSLLSEKQIRQIIDIASRNELYYHFYSEDSIHTVFDTEEIDEFYNKDAKKEEIIDIIVYDDMEEIFKEDDLNIYKFIFIHYDEDKLNNARRELEEIKDLNITSSFKNNIEIMNKDISKGNTLEILADRMDISSDEIIAIGDNNNDISMIKYAGLGVAMGNGEDSVKEIADIVTSSNTEYGVAKIIEEYILEK